MVGPRVARRAVARMAGAWLAMLAVAACGGPIATPEPSPALGEPIPTSDSTAAESRATAGRTASPSAPAEPTADSRVTVEQVTFSRDMRTVRLEFVGAPPPASGDDPCGAEYEGWARDTGETLEVAAVQIRRAAPDASGGTVLCTAMGHLREATVELTEPFAGRDVRNLDGEPSPLVPAGTAHIWEIPADALPAGWGVQPVVRLVPPTPPTERVLIYAPSDFPRQGDDQLSLTQWLDPATTDGPHGVGTVTTAEVDGAEAFLVEGEQGDLWLSWTAASGDVLTLQTHEDVLRSEELIAIAEAVRAEH